MKLCVEENLHLKMYLRGMTGKKSHVLVIVDINVRTSPILINRDTENVFRFVCCIRFNEF